MVTSKLPVILASFSGTNLLLARKGRGRCWCDARHRIDTSSILVNGMAEIRQYLLQVLAEGLRLEETAQRPVIPLVACFDKSESDR